MLKNSSKLALLIILFACGGSPQKEEKAASPRIRKESKLISPKYNQNVVRGTDISFDISIGEGKAIDSVLVSVGNETFTFNSTSFTLSLPSRKVGSQKLKTQVFFEGKLETHYPKVIVLSDKAPEELTYEVINSYPHASEDYTQGLLIQDGILYESTGQEGESSFIKKDLKTGKTLQLVNLPDDLFGEGLAFLNNEFYQLTWQAGKGFVYNKNMEQTRSFSYQTEGWGITAYEDQLIMTTGDEKILFIDPSSFTVTNELEVYDHNEKLDSLNELEVIDGLIYANIWLKDLIVVIDPETGEVLRRIDMSGLLSDGEKADADVLNGIAYDQKTQKIYVTGKYWPKLFEVRFKSKKQQL